MLAVLLAAALVSSSPIMSTGELSFTGNPELVISNIRQIDCDEGSGSGWIIGKNILATANHVAELTNCHDSVTKVKLKRYKEDKEHDFALMTGNLPDYGEYIKYSCEGYRPGSEYLAIGWSSMGYPYSILRSHRIRATGSFTEGPEWTYRDGEKMPRMRIFDGYTVPGMSGSPYTKDGVAYGIVSAGYGMNTIVGYGVFPEVYSMELKDTILCSKPG